MITFEEFKSRHSRIFISERGRFEAEIDGESVIASKDMIEVQDELEDALEEMLKDSHKYSCEFCNTYFQEEDVEHRIEDQRFTAPLGSTFVLGGDVQSVAVCPNENCRDDLEVLI